MDKEMVTINLGGEEPPRTTPSRKKTSTARKHTQSTNRKRQTTRHSSNKHSTKKRGTSVLEVISKIPKKVIAVVIVALIILIAISSLVRSCSVSHKTPERVVKALVESYTSGNTRKVKKCYGVSKADDTLSQEISSTIKYYEAFGAEKTEITQCDSIYQDGNYTYMYITFNLVLKSGQSYPCISTYMVQKKDDNKYYVMTPSDITDELSQQAATKYTEFMNTQAYKDYTTAYDKFIKKNPGYEEKIATKLKDN